MLPQHISAACNNIVSVKKCDYEVMCPKVLFGYTLKSMHFTRQSMSQQLNHYGKL